MFERMLVWLIFVLVVLGVCWLKPNAARIFLGFFFVLMGIGFHIALVLTDPHAYNGYSTAALLPLYRWAFRTIITRMPLLFALGAGGFEIAIGLLLLGKGRRVTIGLIGGSLFLLAITPLVVETLPNALLALGLVYLTTKANPISFWEMVRTRLHRHVSRAVP